MDTQEYGEGSYICVELLRASPTKRVYIRGDPNEVDGKFGPMLELPVELDGKIKKWSLKRAHVISLQTFGAGKNSPKDSRHWVGKYVDLSIVTDGTREIIIATPVIEPVVQV